jgi:glutamine---fructose-6-phosphate transaminase (isomerizing)
MSLYSEIFEQPETLRQLIESQAAAAKKIASEIRSREPGYVFLAARGTSDNAGRYLSYLWGSRNRLPVALATPSLFSIYGTPPRLQGALVVGISQSGQSADILAVLTEASRQGCMTLSITNEPASPLAHSSDYVFDIYAGKEKSVAATKTYTAELASVALLSAALAQDEEMFAALARLPEWVAKVLEQAEEITRQAERYTFIENCVVLGRGFNYATAFEWSLKIKELTYIVADPYSPADFQHGPIALVDRLFPVLAVAPSGAVYPDLHELLTSLKEEKAADLVVISDRPEALQMARTPIALPAGIPEWLSPIPAIVGGQLFTWALCRAKGLDPEKPRGLLKVTVTR